MESKEDEFPRANRRLPPLPPPPTVAASVSSSRPPPPNKLVSTATKSPMNNTGGSDSSTPLPPPPSLKLPPTLATKPASAKSPSAENEANEKGLRLGTNAPVHSTNEQIPDLLSAPNSGSVLVNANTIATTSFTATSGETFSDPNDAVVAESAPNAPPSSWTTWAAESVQISAAGSLLEKAGQLAKTTVESGLTYAETKQVDTPRRHDEMKDIGMLRTPAPKSEYGKINNVQDFPRVPMKLETPAKKEVKDNFADLFSDAIVANAGRATSAAAMEDSRAVEPVSDPPGHLKPLKQRAYANPSLSALAARQSQLTVLILPTANAQTIATKNKTTLSDMFRVYGNLRPTTKDSSLEPMLPPFRSAHRSIALNWDHIHLNFVSNDDFDTLPIDQEISEKALGIACQTWDEDRMTSSGLLSDDVELNDLEDYVISALNEEEMDDRLRRKDGLASMTSIPPSRYNTQEGYQVDESSSHHDVFPISPRAQLAISAESAFTLTSSPKAPWLHRFRYTLDASTNGLPHEMICSPSVVLLITSSSDDYINCLAELANVHHLPKPYHDGHYDPNGLRREFLVLHDVIHGPADFDEQRALQKMRNRFGVGCCNVLKVNSLSPQSVRIDDGYNSAGEDSAWERSSVLGNVFSGNKLKDDFRPVSNSKESDDARPIIRGVCLSPSDKRAIRRYSANMVATGLIPAIERRIAHLNSTVNNAKKGVKNVIKSFWRQSKPKDAPSTSEYDGLAQTQATEVVASSSVRYKYDTIESQTRLLADTLFLMRDYDAALGVYRLVKDDYKHDKAHLHHASTQEMMALCMNQLNDPNDDSYGYDIQHSIETALYSYSRAGDVEKEGDASNNRSVRPTRAPFATRLATRFCLSVSSSRSICNEKHMKIADLLASASSHETPLGAAVLLEQSSSHYYQANMTRKYAFHMLMAGHMFRSANQPLHAFRCFAASLNVYQGERWNELRGHLRSALAAQLFGMDRFALSMQFYCQLIGSGGGRVSTRSQAKFLNHVISICMEHKDAAFAAVDRMHNDESPDQKDNSIDAVVNNFDQATRQVEVPSIGFPRVVDGSIRISVDNGRETLISLGRNESIQTEASGSKKEGDESIWHDLMNCTTAELRVCDGMISTPTTFGTLDSGLTKQPPLSDISTDSVITELDKEERDAEYRERQKRKVGSQTPVARALSEPLVVSFRIQNPLGIEVELTEIQLMASLTSSKLELKHTNEYSITKSGGAPTPTKTWNFHGSQEVFHCPDFMCQLPSDSNETAFAKSNTTVDEQSNPFFVVSKTAVNLASASADGSMTVSLRICPLVEGDLSILGVRFSLSGQLWMQHRFHVPGPLLQDTQENKSNRARGKSLELLSKIEPEMPSLNVSIAPDDISQETVLQGQTREWRMTLTNVGYSPASNIVLKTNSPWLNFTDSNQSGNENSAISYCVGPSGTLMMVPCKGGVDKALLQPGESVEIPFVMRTSGGGRQDFYMLFRYEREGDSIPPRHRWTRKLLSVPVYPSVTMSASLMPSYSTKGQHVLSVELMNYRSDGDSKLEIYLNKICIASRHFKVTQLVGQVDSSSASIEGQSSFKIGWQERVTLHYLVVPIQSNTDQVSFSNLTFLSDEGSAPEMHGSNDDKKVVEFMCREKAHESFISALHSHRIEKERLRAEQEQTGQPRHVAQIRRAKTSLSEQNLSDDQVSTPFKHLKVHPTSLSSLCPSDAASSINIICCWNAIVGGDGQDNITPGQHHLRDLIVRPRTNESRKGCPLVLTAKYDSRLFHGFKSGPVEKDLIVTIRNRLSDSDVEFEFSVNLRPDFDFIGATSFHWSLSGGDEISVPMKVKFYCAGVYNIQSVRLAIPQAGGTVPFLFPFSWDVVVEDIAQ